MHHLMLLSLDPKYNLTEDTNMVDDVPDDVLRSLRDVWKNTPPSWNGTNPCQEKWEGVGCTNLRVTSMYSLALLAFLSL